MKKKIFAFIVATVCALLAFAYEIAFPVQSDANIAKQYARKNGYIIKGYLGELHDSCNGIGGCKVSIKFTGLANNCEKEIVLSREHIFQDWAVLIDR